MTTSMLEPRHFVPNGDVQLAVYQWGEDRAERPKLLLVHGTGFCAPVWQSVAESLASEFVVYAIDRRGHGLSSKPEDAYHFLDFAEDLLAVIDRLGIEAAYGVGHSAGATDLLLATSQRPAAFRRIFAMEPTVMDPRERPERAELSAERREYLANVARRRTTFSSDEDVVRRYQARPAFIPWRPELLELYVQHGFEACADGSVRLRCVPQVERAMLVHIFAAMDGSYRGDGRGNPFEILQEISSPTCIATTDGSDDIYKEMAEIAATLVPCAQSFRFARVGHSVAQEQPDDVVSALRTFWGASG